MTDTDMTAIMDEINEAISRGDVNKVKHLFNANPMLVRARRLGKSWLNKAATINNQDTIDFLIAVGCDVNEEEEYYGSTPLTNALRSDLPNIAARLLKSGADPNGDRSVITAIVGTNKHSLEMVKLLDQYGADLHAVFENNMTKTPMNALGEAVKWGKKDVEEYLRSRGCVMPSSPKVESREAVTTAGEIIAYFAEHFGAVQKLAVMEIVPTEPRIAINIIPASPQRNRVTLFTTGMSDLPLGTSEEGVELQFAELFIELPGDWKPTQMDDINDVWPILWLRRLAKEPHESKKKLEVVTIIPNGEPAEPWAFNARFDSMMIIAEREMVTRSGQRIRLFRLVPLYPEERELAAKMDTRALLRSFERRQIPFDVDLKRPTAG